MELRPLDSDGCRLAAGWLAEKDNHQWLDFGNGVQALGASTLQIMAQRELHLMRVFTADCDDAPIGLVALSNIDPNFKTATLWFLLGDKSHARQGYTARAVSRLLSQGFTELGLKAVNAWAVDRNTASIKTIQRNNFRPAGRLRQCHYIDGHPHDRLLFDILKSEHQDHLK
jgi:RimJ/RimL family protein N-acetyltransferase